MFTRLPVAAQRTDWYQCHATQVNKEENFSITTMIHESDYSHFDLLSKKICMQQNTCQMLLVCSWWASWNCCRHRFVKQDWKYWEMWRTRSTHGFCCSQNQLPYCWTDQEQWSLTASHSLTPPATRNMERWDEVKCRPGALSSHASLASGFHRGKPSLQL